MRVVLQRVKEAKVVVEDDIVGHISNGFLIFLGVGKDDNKEIAEKLVKKIVNLRIFRDEHGKTNLSLKDVNGELLVVSQFTLYADCKKGNRPNFMNAGEPQKANELYEYFVSLCKEHVKVVNKGVFGADMQVELVNQGPFTIMLDSDML